MQLSEQQRRVVNHRADAGHLLILAAPGSGKTRTVVERIRLLTEAGRAEPGQILAMTFSRKAAEELRERLGRADLWAGTFHQICADLLKEHGTAIGWGPPLRIYDEARARQALETAAALSGVGVDADDPRRYWFFQELVDRIGRRKRSGLPEAAAAGDRLPDRLVARIDEAYCRLLASERALDYDDLIVRGIETLRDPDAAAILQGRLRYVFLDEFHDVSPEQYELVRLLSPPRRPGGQVLAVADPDQAIYGWRGADAQGMLAQFRRDYRPATHALHRNFRSTRSIVLAAGAVMKGRGVTQPGAVDGEDGHRVSCVGFPDQQAEANGLVALIERARTLGSYRHGDIAVLYRTHARADAAENALLRGNVPVWRVQPDRFFNRPDVQEALRYLELVVALHDDCFEPALNWPRVLVDELTMVHMRRVAATAGITLCDLARLVDDFGDQLSPLTRASVRDFLDTIDAGLAPLIDDPIDRVVERLLAVLTSRRSPIPRAARQDLRGVLDYLAGLLQHAVDHLTPSLKSGRPIALRYGDDSDATAAATILAHVFSRYLRHPVLLVGSGIVPDGAYTITLGESRRPDVDGLGLAIHRTRAFAYSIATLAWRLGQMLLMQGETLHEGRFVLFDLETGSRHPSLAEIVEIVAQPVRGGKLDGDSFVSLMRPSGPRALAADATELNGLTWATVRNAPPPSEVIPRFLSYVGDATLVGHHIEAFDYPVLRRAVRAVGLPAPGHALIDTWKLARRVRPDAVSHRLLDLAHLVDPTTIQDHRALSDARLNALVFRDLLEESRRERELDTLDELLPLVALGIDASGVPIADENATLVLAGARAALMGRGADPLAQWRRVVGNERADDADAWLTDRVEPVPADDTEWHAVLSRWRDMVGAYCLTTDDHSLRAFLHYAALAQNVDYQPLADPVPPSGPIDAVESDPRRIPASERVAMMTVHQAKGKEWPLVFILGGEGGQFSFWRADDEEEERRVLYVGMSRAKRRLCILWARETKGRRRELSRFLRGLPLEIFDRR